jgi:alpha-1,3-rhamnosyl/mannosyltransferase
MRVTIDAVPLLVRSAGVKNYLYYWTQHLSRQAGAGREIQLFPFLSESHALNHEASTLSRAGTQARLAFLYLLNQFSNDIAGWMDSEMDVFHACKLLNPPRHAKVTATIHDLTCWLMPEMHPLANVIADERFASRVLTRADGLIAVSSATLQDAVRILRLPEKKIQVIHHGVGEQFFEVKESQSQAVRARYGLDRPYLLFVGTIEPRKNLDLLLDAYLGLEVSVREEFELVLAGPAGWAPKETMARLANLPSGLRYLGYVPEGELPGLVAGATAFVYPSLYEGFGFPVAQAMAAGVPVITSAVSALPEVAGEAALLVDPRSEAELRNALRSMLTSESLRRKLVDLGRINARRFSWDECARQSWRFFERVAGGKR